MDRTPVPGRRARPATLGRSACRRAACRSGASQRFLPRSLPERR